ncbi:MAG: alcohol dehydrogenase [Lentisphaerae bacterium]|nr:MAG: alcohol dehydrogenase [Lentisphaerota bacterium]
MAQRLQAVAPMKVAWTEIELTSPQADEIRLKSEFSAAKHGTEMAFVSGKAGRRGDYDPQLQIHLYETAREDRCFPWAVGNCVIGRVTETGSAVTHVKVGDRVLIEEVPFQDEHVVKASRAWLMPETLNWKSAACLDPSLFALGAVRDGNVRAGDQVAIFGLGAIGLMAVQVCRLAGAAKVIAVDPIPARREIAASLGADHVIDPMAVDAGREIKLLTGKRGTDVTIEISGNMQALQAAIRATAFGGNVVAAAFPGPYPAGLDLGAEAHLNRPNLIFSRACSDPGRDHPRWDFRRIRETCWNFICAGKLDGEPIVQPVIDFRELADCYIPIASDPQKGIKLGVRH